MADAGKHVLNGVHCLGVQCQVVSEDSRDDNEQDRPTRQRDAFEHGFNRPHALHVPDAHARRQ